MNDNNSVGQRLKYLSNPLNLIRYVFIRFINKPRLSLFNSISDAFNDKVGVEIGGPSQIFSGIGLLPIYPLARTIDGCNFNKNTLWETELTDRGQYRYKSRTLGKQYVMEATQLEVLKDKSYDFVISSHCLEHVANPLKAIEEWIRVLKPNGIMLIVVPDKHACFDHKRPYTTFAHLKADYLNQTEESDLTHLDEILELHDLKMDPQAGGFTSFEKRCMDNYSIRGMHHHVFSEEVLQECLNYFGLESKTCTHKGNVVIYSIKN